MPLNLAMSVMSVAELVLWAGLGLLFWSKKLNRRFPAMGAYLALRMVSTPALFILLYAQAQPWGDSFFPAYFFGYWSVYIASAVILFFVCMEVFRSALAPFAGLMKFGVVIFRWAVLASLIVTFSSVSFAHKGILIIPDIALGLMRSVSILELCVLGFLCLAMNSLRLSVRDLAFGIALGFGLMGTNDLVMASFLSHISSLVTPLQFVYQSVVLVVLGLWASYAALPAPAPQPVVMPVNSTIYRWNEIASALGHTGTQVAVQPSGGSFFLTDVESVVEKVINRNLKRSESKP